MSNVLPGSVTSQKTHSVGCLIVSTLFSKYVVDLLFVGLIKPACMLM